MGPIEFNIIYNPEKSGFGTYENFTNIFQQINGMFSSIKNGIINASTGGYDVSFDTSIGTNINGLGYTLTINCYDSNGVVGYNVSNRSQNGFTITPDVDASIEYCAIPLFNV